MLSSSPNAAVQVEVPVPAPCGRGTRASTFLDGEWFVIEVVGAGIQAPSKLGRGCRLAPLKITHRHGDALSEAGRQISTPLEIGQGPIE